MKVEYRKRWWPRGKFIYRDTSDIIKEMFEEEKHWPFKFEHENCRGCKKGRRRMQELHDYIETIKEKII